MAIQWYPGHMHKAQKEIKQALASIDVIIEVIDARIPYSSSNPVIAELKDFKELQRPIIKLMNKSDMADPRLTEVWRCEFENQQNVKALPVCARENFELAKIKDLVRKLAPQRINKQEAVKAMIMGIPNVGKSTLINALAGRKIAKTGNEPAITQRQQRIDLDDIILFDTPGILWPKIENDHSSFRLAISGAIKDTVVNYEEIGFYFVEYLAVEYPTVIPEKYQVELCFDPDGGFDAYQTIEAIGKKRGCLVGGGKIDRDKACKIIINEFRNTTLGGLTLETPTMIGQELIEVEEKIRLKALKKAERKNKPGKR